MYQDWWWCVGIIGSRADDEERRVSLHSSPQFSSSSSREREREQTKGRVRLQVMDEERYHGLTVTVSTSNQDQVQETRVTNFLSFSSLSFLSLFSPASSFLSKNSPRQ